MVLPNPLGGVLDRNWPDGLSDTLAAQVDDAGGLQFSGRRYYDPFVGGYVQPNPFGGGPGAPQSLNRFSAVAGALPAQPGNRGIPPLLVDIGKSTVSNSIGAGLGNRLETIPGRLVSAASQWRMLQIQILPWARGRYYAWTMAEFIRHRVQVGPFWLYHSVSQDKRFHKLLVSRLPDNPVSLARSLSRNGVTIDWHPAFRPLPSQVWEFNFLLNKVSPELAEHFTLGSFASGGLADALIGGFLQGLGDYNRHNLWAQDPWLATRRVGAAAGANATVGLIGGGATAGVLSLAVWLGAPTPPGLVVAGITIGVTVTADILIGDSVKKKWFQAFDADRPNLEN